MPRLILSLVILTMLTMPFLFQSRSVGLQPGHLGWVGSHGLAIAEHVDARNGFVGYALNIFSDSGERDYVYFDRYPVLFSTLTHFLLKPSELSLSQKIFRSRLLMNTLFVLTLLVLVGIGYIVTNNLVLSLAAALLAGSGSYLIYYREMYHFDQPAILGMGLFIMAAAAHLIRGRSSHWVFASAVIAVLLGRGYSTLFVVMLWFLVEQLQRPFYFFRSVPLRALALGVFVAFLSFAHNAFYEARLRKVSILETSVVHSASKRLGFDREFEANEARNYNWITATGKFLDRTANNLVPYALKRGEPGHNNFFGVLWLILFSAVLILCIVKTFSSSPLNPIKFRMWMILIFSGAIWLLPLKRLSIPHDYTIMYQIFCCFSAYLFLLEGWNKALQSSRKALLLLSGVIFSTSLYFGQKYLDERAKEHEAVTLDFERIQSILPPSSSYAIDGDHRFDFIKGLRFGLGFFLSHRVIAPLSQTPFLLTRNPRLEGENLTPSNQAIFLFRLSDDQKRNPAIKRPLNNPDEMY